MGALSDRMRKLFRYGDLWLVVALFGTILLLILPVPPFVLDLLLAVSIALSLLTCWSFFTSEHRRNLPGSPPCCCSSRCSGWRSTSPRPA